jgi:hypothetical protein
LRIYSFRSSSPASKDVNSRALLAAAIILIVLVPVSLVAALYYLSQPVTRQNVPIQSQTPAISSPAPVTPTTESPASPVTPSPNIITYPTFTLSEAIAAGYVEANITGVTGTSSIFSFNFSFGTHGASSGDSIILHIKRLVNYTIEITPIPLGTLLVPNLASAQTMAILTLRGIASGSMYAPREIILLSNNDPVDYLFSAYCVDFEKDNPTELTVFTQSGNADPNVIKIFNALSQLSSDITSVTAIQAAVFVVTNDVSKSELTSRFTSDASEIANAKTILQTAGIDTSNKRLFQ